LKLLLTFSCLFHPVIAFTCSIPVHGDYNDVFYCDYLNTQKGKLHSSVQTSIQMCSSLCTYKTCMYSLNWARRHPYQWPT